MREPGLGRLEVWPAKFAQDILHPHDRTVTGLPDSWYARLIDAVSEDRLAGINAQFDHDPVRVQMEIA